MEIINRDTNESLVRLTKDAWIFGGAVATAVRVLGGSAQIIINIFGVLGGLVTCQGKFAEKCFTDIGKGFAQIAYSPVELTSSLFWRTFNYQENPDGPKGSNRIVADGSLPWDFRLKHTAHGDGIFTVHVHEKELHLPETNLPEFALGPNEAAPAETPLTKPTVYSEADQKQMIEAKQNEMIDQILSYTDDVIIALIEETKKDNHGVLLEGDRDLFEKALQSRPELLIHLKPTVEQGTKEAEEIQPDG